MIFNLNGYFDNDMLEKLIAFYNSLPKNIVPTVMMSSNGGENCVAEMMKIIIESRPSKLIAYNKIQSSAFWLFFKTDCTKILEQNCYGMYHQSFIEVELNQNVKPVWKSGESQMIFMKKFLLPYNEEFCRSMNFTEAEMKKYRKGDDVYFMPDRMKEFLSIVKKL